jgi:hypothetical protein
MKQSLLQPSISVNKLGEFIYGTEAKKRSILRTIKFPSTFINARYNRPKNAVIHFMLDERHDLAILESTRKKIDQGRTDTDWHRNNKVCCLKAMDELIICSNTILAPYLGYQAQSGLPKKYSSKVLAGVSIHLNPDILLLSQDGQTIVGAIRLIFSKARAIAAGEGQVIAGLIKAHIEGLYKVSLRPANCVVLDVFHKKCMPAVNVFKPLEIKVEKACREIMQLWPNITK